MWVFFLIGFSFQEKKNTTRKRRGIRPTLTEHRPPSSRLCPGVCLCSKRKAHLVKLGFLHDLRKQILDGPAFMSRVITGDENFTYACDANTSELGFYWKSLASGRSKKSRQVSSMLIGFFILRDYAPEFILKQQTGLSGIFWGHSVTKIWTVMQRELDALL